MRRLPGREVLAILAIAAFWPTPAEAAEMLVALRNTPLLQSFSNISVVKMIKKGEVVTVHHCIDAVGMCELSKPQGIVRRAHFEVFVPPTATCFKLDGRPC